MNSIVIVDTETTGLDPTKDSIVEIGAVLYSLTHRTVIESFSALVNAKENAAEGVNRIPSAAVRDAAHLHEAVGALCGLINLAEKLGPACFMAHRAEFDRGFLSVQYRDSCDRLLWVCSKFDVEWPNSKPGASCVEMALAHGVPVVSAHRALTDCMLIAKTIENVQAMGHDMGALLARALRPKATFRALVSYDDREKAKAAGFQWDAATKQWLRRMAKDDAASLGFEVREVA